MPKKQVIVSLSEGLFEAATAAASKQSKNLEDILRDYVYSYAERYAPEVFWSNTIPQEETPPVFRLANAILSNAIDKGASEIYLFLQTGHLSAIIKVDGNLSEMMTIPPHITIPLFDRYAFMSSNRMGIRKSSIPIRHNDKDYQIFLSWDGDYSAEMILRIVPTSSP